MNQNVEMIRNAFFNRTDKIAIMVGKNPHPIHVNGYLDQLILGHITGNKLYHSTVEITNDRGTHQKTGCFRLATYSPNNEGLTKWLCLDFDGGPEHKDALRDPESAVKAAYETALSVSLPCFIERSGRGHGYHLWLFFEESIIAKDARRLGFLLCPPNQQLENGGYASPGDNRGIEVFPKTERISNNGCGNAVWLPLWYDAKPGCNRFYKLDDDYGFEEYEPELFETISVEKVQQAIKHLDRNSTMLQKSKSDGESTEVSTQTPNDYSEWRQHALGKLDLNEVYGEFLTGRTSMGGWLECRDPDSSSGDRHPSASVASGEGAAEKGKFHSFRSGQTISVFDFLIKRGVAKSFIDACRRVADKTGVPLPATGQLPETDQDNQLPSIIVNNRQLPEVIADAWDAIIAQNDPPRIFVFGQQLIELKISSSESHLTTHPIGINELYSHLYRCANWVKVENNERRASRPSDYLVKDMLTRIDPRIPVLDTIVRIPIFRSDGILLSQSGYDSDSRIYLDLPDELANIEVPEHPTKEEIEAAKRLFTDDLLVNFPFEHRDADCSTAIALLILPFVRHLINGCTPLHLIDASIAGSGKSKLCDVVSIIATGKRISPRAFPENNDELKKMILAELIQNTSILLFDNFPEYRKLNSDGLALILTSTNYSGRLLGRSEIISLPNRMIIIITANNIHVAEELSRRIIRCRITPVDSQPWKRTDFKHSEIELWAMDNRRELVTAILVLIRSWLDTGKPDGKQVLGSFEQWAKTIGGVFDAVSISGFMSNCNEVFHELSMDTEMYLEFTESWWNEFKSDPVQTKQLLDLCNRKMLLSSILGEDSDHSNQTRLGKALNRIKGRLFGNLQIEIVHDNSISRGKCRLYRLRDKNNIEDRKTY